MLKVRILSQLIRRRRYSTPLVLSSEIQAALKNKLPIVALESTIISHGMPFPRNMEVAKEVEDVVRRNGAIPATIAVINGEFKIGLSEEDLLVIANPKQKVYKASRRDLPFLAASRSTAGTTVAGTMILAQRAGS